MAVAPPPPPSAPPPPVVDRPDFGIDCWVLSGPTASGKTSLALRLAARLGAEIVSVDSMAVYRGLDVGTAKPTAAERRELPHHLVDVAAPGETYSVARWLAAATAAVADCRRRGRGILFVGGTPLYLRALRDGLAPLPAADPAIREELAAEAASVGSAGLHGRLAVIDPHAAARIHPQDTRRIIRGLEVARLAGEPLSTLQRGSPDPLFEERLLVLDLPRRILHDRIDRRVDRMFSPGPDGTPAILAETRSAVATPGGIGPTARQAAGYAEAIELLAGRIDLATALARTKRRTRQLAKRQRTWLRSFRRAVWITA
jgi:tRNA dimethylallyltransferase